MKNKTIARFTLAALLTIGLVVGCAKLQPGGAYAPTTTNSAGQVTATVAPDKAFYAIDAAADLAYRATDVVFAYERDNRAALWAISPNIKHTLDSIRPQAADAVKRYALARAAYRANPIAANLTGMEQVLAQLQAITAAAAAALPQTSTSTIK